MKGLNMILTILLVIYSSISTMKFNFKVQSVSMRCLAEFLSKSTLAVFTINADSKEIRVRIFDPNGNAVVNKENNNFIKISYTSNESGNYQICIDNYGPKDVKINFEILTGIYAKDYSELAKKDSLKPIELNLQKLEDLISFLIHEFSTIMSLENKGMSLRDAVSFKIVVFSIGFLTLMSIVSVAEVYYIRQYFYKRKII